MVGSARERWGFAPILDALRDAARRAGTPGWIWLVGITYPGLNLSVDLVRCVLGMIESATGIAMPGSTSAGNLVFLFGPPTFREGATLLEVGAYALVLFPVYLLLYRLIVGLAKSSDPASNRSGPIRLGTIWHEGKELGASACGMWLLLFVLLVGVTLFLLGPLVTLVHVFELERLNPLLIGLILPILFLVLSYATVLQVLNQLGLHSLAHNRRGVASALTHAWRLVRGSPWSAARATLIDFGLFLALIGTSLAIQSSVEDGSDLRTLVSHALQLTLHGFVGVTRAGFWARAYRALGGLSADDRVPGLE